MKNNLQKKFHSKTLFNHIREPFWNIHSLNSLKNNKNQLIRKRERAISYSPNKHVKPNLIVDKRDIIDEIDMDFLKCLIMRKFCIEMVKYIKIFQKNFRIFLKRIYLKRYLLIKLFRKNINYHITLIQKTLRRYLSNLKNKNFIAEIRHSYFLILGDYKNEFIPFPKSMKLIKYDINNEGDMIFYDFIFIKSLKKFVLFMDKNLIGNGKILVNFVADGIVFDNFIYKSIQKSSQIIYNIIDINDKSYKNKNLIFKKAFSIPSENYNKLKLRKYSLDPSPSISSPIKIKTNQVISPILKKPSFSLSNSKIKNSKKVKFRDFLFESR